VFIPTYPFGVVSEMLLLYHALPVAKATGMYSLAMPNVLNFGFSWHKFMIVRPFFPLPCGEQALTARAAGRTNFAWLQAMQVVACGH
jgi:hypothetical protein